MAAKANRRDLYLSVNGNVSGLEAAMKAGRTVLNTFGTVANDTAAEVEKALKDMGAGAPSSAKAMERAYAATFQKIRENARSVLDAPNGSAAVQVINAAGAGEAAAAAEARAQGLRLVADAAARAAAATQGDTAAARVYATAAEAAAQGAQHEAEALRAQATVLGAVERELGDVAVAQQRHTAISGQQRAAMQNLGFQFQDFTVQVVSGQSAFVAFAQQMPQAAGALAGFEGRLGAVGSFLSGGLGVAITVGLVALTPFVAKILEQNEGLDGAIEKLREDATETKRAADAKEAFSHTIGGVTEALQDQAKALQDAAEAEASSAERSNIAAQRNRDEALSIRQKTAARLADARAALDDFSLTGGTTGAVSLENERKMARVAQLEEELAAADKAVVEAERQRNLTRVDLAQDAAKRMADPIARINKLYDDQALAARNAAREAAKGGATVTTALTRQLGDIERKREAALEAERKRQAAANSTSNPNRQTGRKISVDEAVGIARGIGGTVTSTTRSREKQQELYDAYLAGKGPLAAKPGTSNHERGQAIDIAKTPGMSLAKIRKAFTDQGVQIAELLDEGKHFHVAWGSKGPSAESIQRKQEAKDQERIRNREAYADLLTKAQQDQLELTRGRTTDIAAAADLDVKSVELARDRLIAEAQAGVEQKRWTQAQANVVQEIYRSNAAAQASAIRQEQAVQLLDQQLSADDAHLRRSSTILQMQADVATTAAERRRIALQILANEEAEARNRAIRLIETDDPAKWAEGEAQLRQIDEEHPYRVGQIERQTRDRDPMEDYRERLQNNVGDINAALGDIEVNALEGLEDGLLGILDGTESVAGAVGKMVKSVLADLARLALQRGILTMIGMPMGFARGGKIRGFATGGRMISGPGTGTSDSILAMVGGSEPIAVSNGESINTAEATRRYWPLIDAMNKGRLPGFATGGLVSPDRIYRRAPPSPQSVAPARAGGAPMIFDLRGAVMTADLLQQMNDLAAQHSQVAIVAGSQMAQQEMAERNAAMIPS
ncbi:hypothetical protein CA235_09685 [Sphingomonas sp. ABOLF]|uniref:D-alanyl-D-alanine carboxypeptidase family protein n=1 Tax=Sphingomonas sp. ABOLF TaxID=1985879 RepID=UPI000F7E2874|nr:D-alanyl-D-alanine carboxypeptidase family protein [Sphingomonas sp. ABOLF]RSV15197.1 hypothetical protein CA235_09685 [Sphingomonas sp. ABOLF]